MSEQAAPRIAVSIGELRLTGFDPHGRNDLGDGVAAELQRLLATADWNGAGEVAIDRLDLGRIAPGATRQATASRIAGKIHAEIEARMRAPTGGSD